VTQNIYDEPEFFDGYAQLPRSVHGLGGAPEWPTLEAMLPDMAGQRVLDLGCGYGWFCRWVAAAGAASVLGLDVSEKMLAKAAVDTDDTSITYVRADLDVVDLEPSAFDVIFSSLALHYLRDLPRLVAQIHAALVPGGAFVFSAEHPIYTAPSAPAFVEDSAGTRTWPLDGYLTEGPRTTNWIADGVVKQHRTLGTYLTTLLHAHLEITDLAEWGPTPQQMAEHSDWGDEMHRPMFLLVGTRRS
jgi:SAM-dependent methyltransferase